MRVAKRKQIDPAIVTSQAKKHVGCRVISTIPESSCRAAQTQDIGMSFLFPTLFLNPAPCQVRVTTWRAGMLYIDGDQEANIAVETCTK